MLARLLACVAMLATLDAAFADGIYARRTDDELSRIAAGWDDLSQSERRALLTEVRGRMAVRDGSGPLVRVQTQRRYGRIIRQPDGSVLHIERREQSVEYRRMPVDPDGRPFGIGFEHRVGDPAPPPSADGRSREAVTTPVKGPSLSAPLSAPLSTPRAPLQNNKPG